MSDSITNDRIFKYVFYLTLTYEIYKQAYIHNLYSNDLETLQNAYRVHFNTDTVMQKKRDEVVEKMSKMADEIKKDNFGKELIKKYPNKSNKEIAHSYLNDCGINWQAGILTFAVFCSILNLFMMDPPKKAKHSSSEELFDMLTDILTDIIVSSLVSDIPGQTTDMFEPIMNPIPNIFHTKRKSSSTTHSDSCTPLQRRRRMSFIQFVLSLFIKDEWKKKYDEFSWYEEIDPYNYNSEEKYLEALRDAWKEHLDPDGEFEDDVDVTDYEDYFDYEYEIEQYQEKKKWQEKYNPEDNIYVFDINVYDFESEEEYLEALQDAWKENLDPDGEFEDDVDVRDYEDYDSYQEAIKKAELD